MKFLCTVSTYWHRWRDTEGGQVSELANDLNSDRVSVGALTDLTLKMFPCSPRFSFPNRNPSYQSSKLEVTGWYWTESVLPCVFFLKYCSFNWIFILSDGIEFSSSATGPTSPFRLHIVTASLALTNIRVCDLRFESVLRHCLPAPRRGQFLSVGPIVHKYSGWLGLRAGCRPSEHVLQVQLNLERCEG